MLGFSCSRETLLLSLLQVTYQKNYIFNKLLKTRLPARVKVAV